MGKSRKDYEKFLNSISPDRDDEAWIIGGKNRYCGRENYGTMIKRYDPIGFNVGYREWAEQPGRRVVRGLLQWPHGNWQQAHRRHGSDGN
jgi:hypothetical protein